jgi:hypothetical protein
VLVHLLMITVLIVLAMIAGLAWLARHRGGLFRVQFGQSHYHMGYRRP